VFVTEDKDFGELMFVRNLPHGPVVRVVELSVDEQVQAIGELLEQHSQALSGQVVVTITRRRIRIRRRDA
jgi:predicted nuclease of predicted toxin-antitoxin system